MPRAISCVLSVQISRILKVLAVTYLGEGGVPETCSDSHDPKASSAVDAAPLGAAISLSVLLSFGRSSDRAAKRSRAWELLQQVTKYGTSRLAVVGGAPPWCGAVYLETYTVCSIWNKNSVQDQDVQTNSWSAWQNCLLYPRPSLRGKSNIHFIAS
jgi:hypothetical protein